MPQSRPAGDEPVDPRAAMQQQLQAMAQELMRTSELPSALKWEEFDFGVDPFDPVLDDLEGLLMQGGAPDRESLQVILSLGLNRHLTPAVRFALMEEVGRRMAGEVLLDIRELGRAAIRALQQLAIPPTSIGVAWPLYSRHVQRLIRERHERFAKEDADLSAEEHQLIEGLRAGTADVSRLAALGDRAPAVIERVLFSAEGAPMTPALAAVAEAAGAHPSMRMARALTALLFVNPPDAVAEAVRRALGRMPEEARLYLDAHISLHDPEPSSRRHLFSAVADLGLREMLPRLVEDTLGVGAWSRKSASASHSEALLRDIVRLGDARAVPMILHVWSLRTPSKSVREAVVAAMSASPWAADFGRGLTELEAGRPVVVARDTDQEEFLHRYAKIEKGMNPVDAQVEIRRAAGLWDACWHEELGWRRPSDVEAAVGPRERELLGRLVRDTREHMGRLAGTPQVAALEAEFRTKWMTTPQNDVSGRIPLAIILAERAERDADGARAERLNESSELYALAIRAHQAKMDDDARHYARAVLQLDPAHPFAKDFLDRLDRGDGIPGFDEGAEGPAAPRIILPP